jgi:hypothetical protein
MPNFISPKKRGSPMEMWPYGYNKQYIFLNLVCHSVKDRSQAGPSPMRKAFSSSWMQFLLIFQVLFSWVILKYLYPSWLLVQPHPLAFAFHCHSKSSAHQYFIKQFDHLKMQVDEMHLMILLYLQEKNSLNQHTLPKCTHKHFVKNPPFFSHNFFWGP